MKYLLDTNVISEFTKTRRNLKVTTWIESQRKEDLFLSVLTFGELRQGAAMLAQRDIRRAAKLADWIDELENTCVKRTLPVTLEIATRWGKLAIDRTLPTIDSLLAATAIEHKLVLVTRNVKDISDTGVDYYNPFE